MRKSIAYSHFFVIFCAFLFQGCLKDNSPNAKPNNSGTTTNNNNTGTNQTSQGQIFYRIQVDLSYPPANEATSCHIAPGDYFDNNNAVPDNASFDTYYGPCSPGTYDAQLTWNLQASTPYYVKYSYTLARPAPGHKRYYSQMLIKYYEGTNRCQASAVEPQSLTFVDEKM